MLNKVLLIGNVGRDPEVRYTDGNGAAPGNSPKVASFTLATTERYKDRSGELKESTEWHNIVAWRNLADLAEKYIRKGTQLYIEGRIRTRQWTDQTGAKRYTTEIQADNIQLLGRRGDNPASAQGEYQGGQQQGGYQQNAYQQSGYNQQRPAYQQPAQPAYQQSAPTVQGAQPEPFNLAPGEDPGDDLPF